jgi:hypothetical protein
MVFTAADDRGDISDKLHILMSQASCTRTVLTNTLAFVTLRARLIPNY